MLSGLINLNKPLGPTSFQVVARLRRVTGVRKIGHAGTLDPLATGVLPICVGRAVRLSEYLQSDDKVYRATIALGVRTTTDDAEGTVVSSQPVAVGRDSFEVLMPEFTGSIAQVPPHYAAIKVAGRPLYALARKGTPVELAPRQVFIERLELLEWNPPSVTLEIACGKGTYIRALARDLGERLGCGAHLSALVRIRCGSFDLSSAVGLDEVERSPNWRQHLIPMDIALGTMPRVDLSAEQTFRIKNGLNVTIERTLAAGSLLRAHDPEGRFMAVLRAGSELGTIVPVKVFHDVDDLE